MTTRGVTELDVNTKTLVIDGDATKYVMVGSSGTWIKFNDGDKIQINLDADVKMLRKGQSALMVHSWNGTIHDTVTPVNTTTLYVFLVGFALLMYRIIKWKS